MPGTLQTLKRNDDLGMAEAFGRDPMLEAKLRELVAKHHIRTVVETGTWRGYTARRFSTFVRHVTTIEIDGGTFAMARETLAGCDNVSLIHGNSAEEMRKIILATTLYPGCGPFLFYLDAHWDPKDWPLLDEIRAISFLPVSCVIVVHDVQVPGTDLGFDSYGGQALTFDFLKPELDKLRFKWTHSFNDNSAQGHRRGALFIEPCEL